MQNMKLRGYVNGQSVRVTRSFDPSGRTAYTGRIVELHSDYEFAGVQKEGDYRITRHPWAEIRSI